MAKYRIAWMPGDGVGHDVMEAARLVLDRLKLDAEYVLCGQIPAQVVAASLCRGAACTATQRRDYS